MDRLPDDLLVSILLFVRDTELESDHIFLRARPCKFSKLPGINGRWRATMLGTPSLWTRTAIESNIHLLDLFVKRSKEAPFDVTLYSNYNLFFTNPLQVQIVRVLIDVSPRLRHLQLVGIDKHALNAFIAFLRPMPILEDLFLWPWDRVTGVVLLLDHFPRLRNLQLRNVPFITSPLPIRELRTLNLSRVATVCRKGGLLSILAEAPVLDQVALRGLEVDYGPSPVTAKVDLPQFKLFRVHDTAPKLREHSAHLAPLAFPDSADFQLSLIRRNEKVAVDDAPVLPDLISGEASLLRTRTDGATRIYLRVGSKTHEIEIGHPGKRPLLDAELSQNVADDAQCAVLPREMHGLAGIFAGDTMRVIELYGDHAVLSREDWDIYLGAFPYL